MVYFIAHVRYGRPYLFYALNKNIEKVLDITSNIIILGDMNEGLLNLCLHNLKDVLLLNSLQNIIDEPTRQLALLDPIILHEDMSPLNQGIIKVPPEISDHNATYVHVPFEYHLNGTFTRNVWMYKYANYELLNKKILSLIGHVFKEELLVNLVYYLQMF